VGQLSNNAKKELAPNNRRENASRIFFYYKVGDKVILEKSGKHLRKIEAHRAGPHTVTAIYTNGTLHIQKGNVNDRVNIRILFPYLENSEPYGSEYTLPHIIVVLDFMQLYAYLCDINISR
jgi:hypothetical protein